MTSDRQFTGISVLIPGYSVEDIPTDLNEAKATGLLNAIACAWHPAVIAAANGMPQFKYADISEIADSGQILLLPECSEEWLGHDWEVQLKAGNCTLLHGLTERSDWLNEIEERFGDADQATPTILVDEFLALGLSWYLVMALSRRMHYYIDPDETRLSTAIRDASTAALQGATEEAQRALKDAFECMLETREQLFPVESFLLDMCLPAAAGDEEHLAAVIDDSPGVNLMISPAEFSTLQTDHPDLANRMKSAVDARKCCVVSGGWHELRSSLNTLSSAYSELQRAAKAGCGGSGIWGQRRFGLMHSLPGLLRLFDYDFALHVALDDGLYPERESGCFHWKDSGTATVLASSRLPIAIDSSASFLRLPERLAESMQQDSAAVVLLARLPELGTTWLQDLRRIHEQCPLIGRFVTFNELLEQVDEASETVRFKAGEYLGPHLIQASVLKTEAPLTGPADLYLCRNRLEQLAFVQGMTKVLTPASDDTTQLTDLDIQLQDTESERLGADDPGDPVTQHEKIDQLNTQISEQLSKGVQQLAAILPAGDSPGRLVVNSLPFSRDTTISWPAHLDLPQPSENIRGAYRQEDNVFVHLKVPAGGFVQITAASSGQEKLAPVASKGRPLAEEGLLRNQHFEAILSSVNGGISDVRFHGQRANRVSQQVAFRYDTPKKMRATETTEERITSYAETQCERMRVVESGPWTGAIASDCVIRHVIGGDIMFRFRQITSVERTSARINILIIPDAEVTQTITGNPWMAYLASRFAWDNESAAISRGLLGQACGFQGERFESPDYIEVADEDQRLLVVPHGRPYHRRTGSRMLDSLLLVEGQPVPAHGFRFTIEFDQLYPQRTVADVLQPVLVEPVSNADNAAGWIIGCSAKNVQVARIRTEGRSVMVLLQETEGRTATCRLRVARTPVSAWTRKATGEKVETLEVTESGVGLNFAPFELIEVQLAF